MLTLFLLKTYLKGAKEMRKMRMEIVSFVFMIAMVFGFAVTVGYCEEPVTEEVLTVENLTNRFMSEFQAKFPIPLPEKYISEILRPRLDLIHQEVVDGKINLQEYLNACKAFGELIRQELEDGTVLKYVEKDFDRLLSKSSTRL